MIKSVSVFNVHAMQEKVNWSFSSGGSNLHSAQAIITSPLPTVKTHSPGVSLHSVFKAWTSLDYHSLCVRACDACNCALHQLFIGHQWTVRSFQMQKRNWPTLQSVDSALPSRCDLQYMTFQRVPTGTVHHLNYNWGLGPWLMMEPGGDCEHVFGCGLFPVNQIMEPCGAAQMWGMSAHKKKKIKLCV